VQRALAFLLKDSSMLPQIVIGEADHDRLSALARAAAARLPEVADYLERELARARIVPAGLLPEGVVTIGSDVTFRDEASGRVRTVRLVLPRDEDIDGGRISVLTPIGAALLGLSVGQSIDWRTRTGQARPLTVLQVAQPEA
jgi:regulator of nucleoside diphosphate kinase